MNKNKYGYKCFEMNTESGELFSLFIDKYTPIPVGVWVHAKCIPTQGFAVRPGLHLGLVPDAPWLKGYDGSARGIYRGRSKKFIRVWGMVEYNHTHDYNFLVQTLPNKCFVDHIPEDGFYNFTEAGGRPWIISSDTRIVKILTEEERQHILRDMHYDEVAAYAKKKAAFEKRAATLARKKLPVIRAV